MTLVQFAVLWSSNEYVSRLLIATLGEGEGVLWLLQIILILIIENDVVALALVDWHGVTGRDVLAALHYLIIHVEMGFGLLMVQFFIHWHIERLRVHAWVIVHILELVLDLIRQVIVALSILLRQRKLLLWWYVERVFLVAAYVAAWPHTI